MPSVRGICLFPLRQSEASLSPLPHTHTQGLLEILDVAIARLALINAFNLACERLSIVKNGVIQEG